MTTPIITAMPDCEIVSTRVFPYAQALVFQAWANPQHLQNWWGPAGFTNTFHVFDFRVGGRWRFTMHGPDKGHYENECEFIQIEAPYLIAWKRHSKPLFNIVASFEAVGEHETKLVFKMLFDTAAACAKLKPYVVDKNEENFDRLEQVLAQMAG